MESKKKIIIVSLVFGATTLALILIITFPLFTKIKKNSQELITIKKELILLQSQIEKSGQLKEFYKSLEGDLEKIDELFVDPGAPVDLIGFWRKTAQDSGLLISDDDIQPISIGNTETDPWNSMGFKITLTGSFPDFLRFLQKIEMGFYLVEIQSLTVRVLTENDLKLEKYEQHSLSDIRIALAIKIYTK